MAVIFEILNRVDPSQSLLLKIVFKGQHSYHIERSQLIYKANQSTGFYTMITLVSNVLIQIVIYAAGKIRTHQIFIQLSNSFSKYTKFSEKLTYLTP